MASTTGPATLTAIVRILVIHPQTLVRQGLVSMFDTTDDLRVVAHTDSSEEGARLAHDFRPDVVVIDHSQAASTDGTTLSDLKSATGTGRVLVLAEHVSSGDVEVALRSGADGFTLTSISFIELLEGVRRLARGEAVLHPDAARALAMASLGRGPNGSVRYDLTTRQREILNLLAEGLQNKQIARRLGIGSQTVKTHVSRILERLETASRTEAVALAMREGLVA